jgi:hypothetical protein
MEILAERLGRPIHEVTKRGGGSWIAAPLPEGDWEKGGAR